MCKLYPLPNLVIKLSVYAQTLPPPEFGDKFEWLGQNPNWCSEKRPFVKMKDLLSTVIINLMTWLIIGSKLTSLQLWRFVFAHFLYIGVIWLFFKHEFEEDNMSRRTGLIQQTKDKRQDRGRIWEHRCWCHLGSSSRQNQSWTGLSRHSQVKNLV